MKPRLILAAMAGGASGVATAKLTGAGLVATPSPGSIFAYLAETPRGGYVSVLAAVLVASVVSFVVASALLGFGVQERDEPLERPEDAGEHQLPSQSHAPVPTTTTAAPVPVARTATSGA
jgi:PTS system mannitol-specific IIC component